MFKRAWDVWPFDVVCHRADAWRSQKFTKVTSGEGSTCAPWLPGLISTLHLNVHQSFNRMETADYGSEHKSETFAAGVNDAPNGNPCLDSNRAVAVAHVSAPVIDMS